MSDDESKTRRNEVFGTGPVTGVQSVPMHAAHKSDFQFDIPVEIAPLPSCGKVYPPDNPLHMRDSIAFRAMTTREENILTSRALIKQGTVITHLIQSCLVDKEVDVQDMLSGDRSALMVALRITGYGKDYDVELKCPECDEKTAASFDLAMVPVKKLDIEPVAFGQNLFEFVMPRTGMTVQWKFVTGRDEEELSQAADRRKKANFAIDDMVTSRLYKSIVSLNGVTDRTKISQAILNLPAADSVALRLYINEHEPGLDMRQAIDCRRCGETVEVDIPLSVDFFWPRSRRQRESDS